MKPEKPSEWEKNLLKLWRERSDKQEKDSGDDVVDFDDLIIDVKKVIEQARKELKGNMLAEFYGDDNLSNKKYEKLLKRINKRINRVLG